jgi:hypothetical protein
MMYGFKIRNIDNLFEHRPGALVRRSIEDISNRNGRDSDSYSQRRISNEINLGMDNRKGVTRSYQTSYAG